MIPFFRLILLLGLFSGFCQNLDAQISFIDNSFLLPTDAYSGISIGVADINRDGLDDIVHLDKATHLYVEYQLGDGTFAQSDYGTVANPTQYQWALTIGDVDGNGVRDVLTGGFFDGVSLVKIFGTDSFSYGELPSSLLFAQNANFMDINNDGHIDAFVCHDLGESKVWTNDGNGNLLYNDTILNTETNPVSDNSGNYGSIWTDFDYDGDIDLYIAKCKQGENDPTNPRRINMLMENDGNNHFTENAAAYGLASGAQSWTANFGDIDNDGDFDCFITNHDVASQLLENQNGQFVNITPTSGITVGVWPLQGVFRDFDNDGYLDIIVCGSGAQVFRNNGNKTFTKILGLFNIDPMNSFGIGDLNNDGFLDIYAGYANGYTTPDTTQRDRLWLNGGNSNHYLRVGLKGSQSNIDGLGAKIEVFANGVKQIREIRSGESYGICNSLIANFGLGTVDMVDSLVVKWPSGKKSIHSDVAVDQYVEIEEIPECVSGNYPVVSGLKVEEFGNSYKLSWNPVNGSIGCQINGGTVGGGQGNFITWGADVSHRMVSKSILIPGAAYQWRVRCGCQINPVIAGNWSAYNYFTNTAMQGGGDQSIIFNENDVEIYPNPVKSNLNVYFKNKLPSFVELTVVNMNGAVILKEDNYHIMENNIMLNIPSGIVPGLYILQLNADNIFSTHKFIIEN